MKRALKIGTVLFALSLPVWANSPDAYRDKDKHRRHENVPEGGNAIAYTIVSSAAILGGLLLARKQRTTKTVSTTS
jgi:hypothetical protein